MYMHKDAGIKRFGPIFEEVPLTQVPDGLKKEHVPEGVNANLFKQAKFTRFGIRQLVMFTGLRRILINF